MAEPKVISVDPSGYFENDWGNWSTFSIQIGTPPQTVNVLMATSGLETIVVTPDACKKTGHDCDNGYGNWTGHSLKNGTVPNFNMTLSTTWNETGTISLIDPVELGLGDDIDGLFADYGHDTIHLSNMTGDVKVKNAIIAGTSSPRLKNGLLGLSNGNISIGGETSPSFLSLLKQAGLIGSMSYGYTAGASYRNRTIETSIGRHDYSGIGGSLTLGGYDRNRFMVKNQQISSTLEEGLLIGVTSIQLHSNTKSFNVTTTDQDLNNTIMKIDSSVPDIWLPTRLCLLFEDYFGFTYDDEANMYLTDYSNSKARAGNVTFTLYHYGREGEPFPQMLTPSVDSGGEVQPGRTIVTPTVDITLPFEAFVSGTTISHANGTEKGLYVSLRRSLDISRPTLGRAFLQEAYLMVDYESREFGIYECKWDNIIESTAKNLVAIPPAPLRSPREESGTFESAGSRPNPTWIIVVTMLGTLCFVGAIWAWRSRNHWGKQKFLKKERDKKGKKKGSTSSKSDFSNQPNCTERGGRQIRRKPLRRTFPHELGGGSIIEMESQRDRPELDAGLRPELEGDREQFELPGRSMPQEPFVHESRLPESVPYEV